jgi:hypothetical protein
MLINNNNYIYIFILIANNIANNIADLTYGRN